MAKTNLVFVFLLLSFILASCSKDQKVVEWLGDGTWLLTSSTVNGVESSYGGTIILIQTYNECKVKDVDCTGFHDYTIEENLGGIVTGRGTFLYRIHEKGTKITLTTLTKTFDGETRTCTYDCVSTWDILEMEENRHVIRSIDDNDDVYILEFQKM